MARVCPFKIDPEKQKELFCRAYVDALVSAGGYTLVSFNKNDDDSIDVLICAKGGPGPLKSPRLEIQLKSTAVPQYDKSRSNIRYPLKQKNYNELIGDEYHTARIIALLVLPATVEHWLRMSEDCLTLYRGCYWLSLRTLPTSSHRSKTRIYIPRTNVFTIDVLDAMMLAIAERRKP